MAAEPATWLSDQEWVELGRLAEVGMGSAELVHELRQPIFAAKALVQLMLWEPDASPERRAHCASVVELLRHVETIIERHDGATRRPGLLNHALDLRDPVDLAVQALIARRRAPKITLLLAPGRSVVHGDGAAVQQIATNLIGNALDAARTRVDVTVEEGVLVVSDDGPGMSEEQLSRAFQPFFTTKGPGSGTGLGLPISRALADGMGAAIEIESSPAGTRVRVRFGLPPSGNAGPGKELG